MALLIFDTHDFITELTEAGMDASQAKALSEGLKKVNLEHVATKADIVELKSELVELRADFRSDMANSRTSLMQWFAGMLVGQAALVTALVKLVE